MRTGIYINGKEQLQATANLNMQSYNIENVALMSTEFIRGQSVIGVEWNQTQDTWSRIDRDGDAISLSRSNFDTIYPWAGARRVNLATTGEINAVYGDDNYVNDGTNGRVMAQYPIFFVRSEMIVEGGDTKYKRWISDSEVAGFEIHPAFNQRVSNPPANNIYIGAYEATLMDDAGTLKMDSKAGEQPWTGYEANVKDGMFALTFESGSVEFTVRETLTGAISGHTGDVVDWHITGGTWGGTDAAGVIYLKQASGAFQAEDLNGDVGGNNMASATGAGTGVHLDVEEARTYAGNIGAGWGLMNIHSWSAITMLKMIEYSNMNSQLNIGKGIVDKAGGTGFAGEETGADDIDNQLGTNGTGTGTGTNGLTPISYRWIENLWGNTWSFIEGYEAIDAAYRILRRDGDWTNPGPAAWGGNDYEVSKSIPIVTDGYISNIVLEDLLKYLLFASAVAGSDTTHIPDNWYAHDAGQNNKAALGGNWDSGLQAGLARLSSYGDVTDSGRRDGARTEFIA